MRIFALIVLTTTLGQQSCDIGGPQARTRAETAIKPYFPDAKISIDANRQTLVTYACANLGRATAMMMQDALRPEMAPLSTLSARLLSGINAFELGFPDYLVHYDVASRRFLIVSTATRPGYAQEYRTSCSPAAPPVLTSRTSGPMIFVGTFRASLRKDADNTETATLVKDTLGIYTEDDFLNAKDAELEGRRTIINAEFAKRGYTLVNLDLVSLDRIAVPPSSQPAP